MSYVGDFRLGDTLDIKFCTVTTTGAPTTLAGTPVISAYVGNSLTQITAGITLTVDFDAVTGLHNVRVVASGANGYATASNYQLVITTGTVGGTSVVGYVVAEFSIENRSALMPTTATRTLDVSAGGEGGVDWANVGSPTTALNLSATNIDVDQVVASVSGAVASVTNDVGITQAGADKVWSSTTRTLTAFSTALALSVWDVLEASVVTASTMGLKVKNNLDAAITSRSSHAAADIWSVTTRLLTAGTNIVLAKGTGVTGFNDLSAANVNTEVVDALNVDTYAQPGQGTPLATTSIREMLGYLYKAWRNRTTQTSTAYKLYNDDAVTVDQKATFSDDATTADRTEVATGP